MMRCLRSIIGYSDGIAEMHGRRTCNCLSTLLTMTNAKRPGGQQISKRGTLDGKQDFDDVDRLGIFYDDLSSTCYRNKI
jgi:hypothetical protein